MISPLKKKGGPPWVRAYKQLVRNSKLSINARLVFLIVKSFANSDGTHCFPTLAAIIEFAGCSRATVKRALAELRRSGLIHSEQRKAKNGSVGSSAYLLNDEIHARAVVKPRRRNEPMPGLTREPEGGSPVSHGEGSKIVPFTERIGLA